MSPPSTQMHGMVSETRTQYRSEDPLSCEDAYWECKDNERLPQAPLKVVLANEEAKNFSDETLVLKIKPQDAELDGSDNTDYVQTKLKAIEGTDAIEGTSGFAINIPVQKETLESDPFVDDGPASWELSSPISLSDRDYDEEDPLLDEPGINMSYKPRVSIPTEGSAFVQRRGARDVAEEQEVLYAVPNPETRGQGAKGLLLPVVDSRDDLRQLVFVVPPDSAPNDHDEEDPLLDTDVHTTTAEATREIVDSFTNQLPAMVEVDSKLEVHGTASNATVAMNVKKQVSWVGYFILFIALASVASQGTAVKWLPNVDGLISATWLMQTQTLIMLPLALFQYFTLNSTEHAAFREASTQRRIVAASLSQVCWAAGFFVAIDHTSLFHAWSLNNVHALIIVLIALVKKLIYRHKAEPVSQGEVSGAQVASVGVLLMLVPLALRGDIEILIGDLVAISGSLGAIAFLNLCKTLRKDVPLFLMMTPIAALNAVFFSVGSVVINGTDFSMTDNGALGWLRADRIGLALYLGGVVGFLGTVCCIAALKFLPNVVVGSVQTMMPVAGTILAIVAGLDTLPDLWTTVGGGVLLYGVLLIAYATRQSEVTVVINPHIQEVGGKSVPV